MKEKVCIIIIRGNSYDELEAVGEEDLKEFFLPQKMYVKSQDSTVIFTEIELDEKLLYKSIQKIINKQL